MAVVDHIGFAARHRGEPTARVAARFDVLDAAQDIRHRAADVLEHSQSRVGRAQARELTHLGREATVLVLMSGRKRGRLGKLGRRLSPRGQGDSGEGHQAEHRGKGCALSHGVLLHESRSRGKVDHAPVCQGQGATATSLLVSGKRAACARGDTATSRQFVSLATNPGGGEPSGCAVPDDDQDLVLRHRPLVFLVELRL